MSKGTKRKRKKRATLTKRRAENLAKLNETASANEALKGTETKMEQKDLTFNFLLGYMPPALRRQERVKRAAEIGIAANVAIVCTLFFAFFLMILVLPHPEASETEKRRLAEMPKFSFSALLSGEYLTGVSEYINDTPPFREKLIGMNSSLSALFGIKTDDGVVFYGQPVINDDHEGTFPLTTTPGETTTEPKAETTTPTETTTIPAVVTEPTGTDVTTAPAETTTPKPTETTTVATTTTPAPEPQGGEEGIISNGIIVLGTRGIMFYGGGMSVGESYAGWVNAYAAELGRDVNVYSMVIPTSVSYYLPEKYASYTASQKRNIDNISSFLNGVKNVDVYSVLGQHTEENIYTRTDHHWAALGAYYAAQEFAKDAGVDFLDISEYDMFSVPGYVGTLYGYTGDATLKNNPEDFIYYMPKNQGYTTTYYNQNFTNPRAGKLFNTNVKGSSLYLTFIGGDGNVVQIDTNVKNGRKLVVFKDSYGNALPCWLTGSFETIYVCDMRYFECNSIEFIRNQGITDVLFASCAFSATGTNAKGIERMRTQNITAPPVTEAVANPEQ